MTTNLFVIANVKQLPSEFCGGGVETPTKHSPPPPSVRHWPQVIQGRFSTQTKHHKSLPINRTD